MKRTHNQNAFFSSKLTESPLLRAAIGLVVCSFIIISLISMMVLANFIRGSLVIEPMLINMGGFIAAGLLGGAVVLTLIEALVVYCSNFSDNSKPGSSSLQSNSRPSPADAITPAEGALSAAQPRNGNSSDQHDGMAHKGAFAK